MSEPCGATHPEHGDLSCDKSPHPYGSHFHQASGTVWDGVPMPDRKRRGRRGDQSRVAQVVERIGDRGKRTGPPVSGPPPQAVTHWETSQGDWLEQARRALHQVATGRERFTTGHVWPLVVAPREKRAMVQVVRHGLRCGWMVEDGAQRESGEYTTLDGVSFPLNKLVPVYRSLIFKSSSIPVEERHE